MTVFEFDIAHRRSVAVLFILYTIMCKPLNHLYDALTLPYAHVRVARGALVHRYSNSRTFIPHSMSLWNDLADPVVDGGWFQNQSQSFLIAINCSLHFCLGQFSLSVLSCLWSNTV